MTKKPTAFRWSSPTPARVRAIVRGLKSLYPEAHCELNWRNPYELLVATILSAQCTDKRVNQVTPAVFRRYPDAAALADASLEELETLIRSCGFFHSKAKNLQSCARALVADHGGTVPRRLEDLVELPGVARKTANVVLGTAYGITSGVVVDTHVTRLARRLGLTREEQPVPIERDLMSLLPRKAWIDFAHRLVWHGRRLCSARKPNCSQCPLAPHCPSALNTGRTSGKW